MLRMTGIDPMRFAAICDTCRAREDALEGTRAQVIEHLAQRSWRVTEDAKTTCADCAGPPSVFPAATLTQTSERCTACGAEVDVCTACRMDFGPDDIISCRGEYGHTHARCSTQKFPKFVPPEDGR
jgi:hypothetical protein